MTKDGLNRGPPHNGDLSNPQKQLSMQLATKHHPTMSLSRASTSPFDLAINTLATGEAYGQVLSKWMIDMSMALTKAGFQVTGAEVTITHGAESVGFHWDIGQHGGVSQMSTMPPSGAAPKERRRIEPSTSQSKSGLTTDASAAERLKKPTAASTATTSKRPSSTQASSRSKSGYTTDASQLSKASKTATSTTAPTEDRKKRRSAPKPTTTSTGISELADTSTSVATSKPIKNPRKEDLAATPGATTATSVHSTKPAKLELPQPTEAGLSELAATPGPTSMPPTTTAPTTKTGKSKKSVTFTTTGFADRPEATSITDIASNRQGKEHNKWRYRDTLTSVDDATRSRLSRYAKSKRLQSYQALAQKTGVPVESASEFWKLASKPDTTEDALMKYRLEHWNRPSGTKEVPYAYSSYTSSFPDAGTTTASKDKDANTSNVKPVTGQAFQTYLQNFAKAAKEYNDNNEKPITYEDYTTFESAARLAGPEDTAALEVLAKDLGHSTAAFEKTRQTLVSGAPNTMLTEGEYMKVLGQLPKSNRR